MLTLETREKIEVGMIVRFADLWDGKAGDALELLESGCVSPDEENIVAFDVIQNDSEVLETLVKVTDIY